MLIITATTRVATQDTKSTQTQNLSSVHGNVQTTNDVQGPPHQHVIYFDYDSSVVKPEYLTMLKKHTGYLKQHPELTIIMEGNTDGQNSTREYDIAEGQRMADSVR